MTLDEVPVEAARVEETRIEEATTEETRIEDAQTEEAPIEEHPREYVAAGGGSTPAPLSPEEPSERLHWELLGRHETVRPRATIRRGWKRCLVHQAPRREHERCVRKHAVDVAAWAVRRGVPFHEAAKRLHVSPRTLRDWRSRSSHGKLAANPRGRHPLRSSLEVRRHALEVLHKAGPSTGLPTLRPLLPKVPRAELTRMLKRFRSVRRARGLCRLTWHRVGSVWAMDFVLPSEPVDGLFPCVFSVCDLASRFQLLWAPLAGETALDVVGALRTLFLRYGPPLVLKCDNGSAFIAWILACFLDEWSVTSLFSPVRRPWYNGACERANGTLKAWTAEEAQREGHPGYWTSHDLQWAQQWNNEVRRPLPRLFHGCTPADLWNARRPISPEEREAFLQTVASNQLAEWASRGYAPDLPLDHNLSASLGRAAVRDALCAHGLLTITPPGSPLPSLGFPLPPPSPAAAPPLSPLPPDPPAIGIGPRGGPAIAASCRAALGLAPDPATDPAKCSPLPTRGNSADVPVDPLAGGLPQSEAIDADSCLAATASPRRDTTRALGQPSPPTPRALAAFSTKQEIPTVALASSRPSCTLEEQPRSSVTTARAAGPAHVGQGLIYFLRRLITPLIRRRKPAKIP